MKKFDQIKKMMEGNKNKPAPEITNINFLPASKFLAHKDKKYDHDIMIKFFETYHITLKDFYRDRECDEKCTACGKNNWLVWQNEFMYYDTRNKCFINIEDDEELEDAPELEDINFAVYVCSECGAWSTAISLNLQYIE